MAGERQTLWAGAATAGATIAAVAICGVVLWNLGAKQREQFVAELSAINAKIDKTQAAIADVQKTSAVEGTGKALAALNTINVKIDRTQAAIADVQKTSTIEDTRKALAALNAEIQKTNTRLAELAQASSLEGIKTALAQLDGKIATTDKAGEARDKTLARLDTAVSEFKSALAGTTSAQSASLQKIAARVDSIGSAAETANKKIVEQISFQNKEAAKPLGKDAAGELMVVYVATAAASNTETTGTVPGIAPLSVRFEKIGSTDASGQTKAVVANLKKIINGRQDCAISVAGYADTLGSDAVNLDVSRERAEAVAAGLRAAFAGQGVEVKKVGWGERQLAVWTPDNKSEMANRRVDISVDCKR